MASRRRLPADSGTGGGNHFGPSLQTPAIQRVPEIWKLGRKGVGPNRTKESGRRRDQVSTGRERGVWERPRPLFYFFLVGLECRNEVAIHQTSPTREASGWTPSSLQ